MKLQVAAVLMALSASFTGCVVEANGVEPPEATEKDREASKKAAYVEAIQPSELAFPLGKASIRSLNSHLDDPTFEPKWSSLTKSPVDFFGGTSSSYFADIATLEPTRLPGREVLCHGDAKFDNFGWTRIDHRSVFSDNDFDDAGYCPVAADAIRYLVARADEPRSTTLSRRQVVNVIRAESAILASRHRKAWGLVNSRDLSRWLAESAATVSARWRAACADAVR